MDAPANVPLELASAQHLAETKRALADGYKPNKDPKNAAWGEVEAARRRLQAVSASAPESREAQELLKEVARREQQKEIATKQVIVEIKPTPETSDTSDEGDSSAPFFRN